MNKEEIEKAIKVVFNEECKKCYFPQKRKCTSCLKESKKIIKKYIQHLEQKEAILNKVTDKLKEDIIQLTEELEYDITKREAKIQLRLLEKYLNIIEGEKKE